MGLPNEQWPQAYFQSCGKMAEGQSQGIGVAITKPWPQSHIHFVVRTEKACSSKEAYKPDSVTPLCQKEWAKIHLIYRGKLVEGYPILIECICTLLTHWE
jgi:hypothetical protein